MFVIFKAAGYHYGRRDIPRYYAYLVSSVREGGKVKQKNIAYLGVYYKNEGKDDIYWVDTINKESLAKARSKIKEYGRDIVSMVEQKIETFLKTKPRKRRSK